MIIMKKSGSNWLIIILVVGLEVIPKIIFGQPAPTPWSTIEQDLKVLQQVEEQLTNKDQWKKESTFGEACSPSASTQTLGCALKNAQIALTGEYQHRNLLMRLVRKKIGKHFFCRQGIHPIDGFNKHPKTTHEEVLFILKEVEQELLERQGQS